MGFLGLQVGFILIVTNTSRILSILGAEPDSLSLFWLVAPISGLLVQPLIGYLSDRTKSRFGKRLPYIVIGSVLSALFMLMKPSFFITEFFSPVISAVLLIFLIQAGFNMVMPPFRALVGDKLSGKQGNTGYSMQTFLINVGSVIGAILPFILTNVGVRNIPVDGQMVETVVWSLRIAAILLIITVLWTCFTVKNDLGAHSPKPTKVDNKHSLREGRGPVKLLLQIGAVQLFCWFATYYFWVYGVNTIAENIWLTTDSSSAAFNDAANWFGILNGIYPVIAAIFSLFLPSLVIRYGRKQVYAFALIFGGIGLGSMFFIYDKYLLFLSMISFGLGWAAILTFPFAILSSAVSKEKMGWYMGLLNITIVVPQIIAGLSGKFLFGVFSGGNSSVMLLIAGITMLTGAVSVYFIKEKV